MITVDFKAFAWCYINALYGYCVEQTDAHIDDDSYISWCTLEMEARDTWCKVEDILDAIDFREEAKRAEWQERVEY